MDTYVLPQLGKTHMGAVATGDVKRVLRPLALAGRIVAVLEWAEAENLRERPPAAAGRSWRP